MLKEKFKRIVAEKIQIDGIYNLMDYLENDTDFFTAPASSRFHSNHEGGLVEHSLYVYENLCKADLPGYSEKTIALVSLFHDICKANYYVKDTRNVKNAFGQWEKVPYYRKADIETLPMGHGEKSVYILMKYIDISDEEALAINWHMGGFDPRTNSGALSDAFNLSPLALELHLADMRATYINENKK